MIENAEKDGEEVFLFSAIKTKKIVLKKYSRKDIQKEEKLNPKFADLWWAWDNHFTDEELKNFFNSTHKIKFILSNFTEERKVKFELKTNFLKYMNQAKGSVKKSLFAICEQKNDIWQQADFENIDTLQFELIDGEYQLSPKKASECTYQEFE